MRVTAIAECFIGANRRRVGDVFNIDESEYTDHRGRVYLPKCVEADPKKAAAIIAELTSRPLRAARESCGNQSSAKVPQTRADYERPVAPELPRDYVPGSIATRRKSR